MRQFLNLFLVFSMIVHGCGVHAALNNPPTSLEKQYLGFKNEIPNPGFESGLTGWSATTTAATITTTSTEIFEGSRAAEWNPAGAESFSSTNWTPKTNGSGNAVGFCRVRSNADADYDLEIWDNTNSLVVAEADIPASSTFILAAANFVAAGGTSYKVQVTSAGDDDEIQIDSCGIGYAEGWNIASVNQAQFIGAAYIAGATNCQWDTTSTTFALPGTDADCGGPTVVTNPGPGTIQTTDANLPRFTVNNLPSGTYRVRIHGSTVTNSSGSTLTCFAVSDGSNTYDKHCDPINSSGGASISVEGWFTYNTSGNRSFDVYMHTTGATTATIQMGTTTRQLHFEITRYPTSSQQVHTTDQSDYGWTSYTPTFTGFGTVTVSSLKHKRIGDTLYIKGRFTADATTGTEARVSYPGSLTAASTVSTVEIGGYYVRNISNANKGGIVVIEPSVGYFTFGTVNTFGPDAGTPLTKALGNALASSGVVIYVDMKVEIEGWTTTNRAPQLVNSVVSSYDGVLREEWAAFGGATEGTNNCSSSPCTLYRNSPAVTSVTRASTGVYTINFAAGTFSQPPVCSGVARSIGTAVTTVTFGSSNPTTTAFQFDTYDLGATIRDSTGYISCKGPK